MLVGQQSIVLAEYPKRIALSIDDAPSPGTTLFTGIQRTLTIIEQLKLAKAPAVGVFAIGRHIQDFGDLQLREYGQAGHIVGNHTFSHCALKNCSVQGYIEDIRKADRLIKHIPGYLPMFRYPFLDEGYPGQAYQIRQALKGMGYTQAYVTVNNFDFYMDSLLQKALKERRFVDYGKLRKVYLQVMLECIEFYHGLAILQGRHQMNHVLLMHSNDLTALYIGDLIEQLRQRGWDIISIQDAYKFVPQEIKNMAIKHIESPKVNPATIRNIPKSMSYKYLTELFRQEKIFTDVKPLHAYIAEK